MKIEDIKKENVFKVPDGYFEDLPLRIQTRIQTGVPVEKVSVFRRRVIWYAVSFAAVVLIALTILKLYTRQPSPEKLLSEVPTSALVHYLETSEISEDELLDNVNSTVISGDLLDDDDSNFDPSGLSPADIDHILNTIDTTNDYL